MVDLRQLYLEINAFVAPIASSSGVESIQYSRTGTDGHGDRRRTTSAKNS